MLNQNDSLPGHTFLYISVLLYSISTVMSFNIATSGSFTFSPPESASASRNPYFGYAVAMVKTDGTTWLLVGAPRGNITAQPKINEPGVFYKCQVAPKHDACEEVVLDTTTTGEKRFAERQKSYRAYGWAGASIDDNSQGEVVVCAPRWKIRSANLITGICYVLTKELQNNVNTPVISFSGSGNGLTKNHGGGKQHYYEHGQMGISARYSSPNKLILGVPGLLTWQGTVGEMEKRPYFGSHTIKSPDPYKTSIISDFNYFGYSLTSGNFSPNEIYYVAGAPRGKTLFGMVLVFQLSPNAYGQINLEPKEEITGTQFGEYFGAAVGAADFDNDALSDLVVGAPFYTEEYSRECGCVYVFMNKKKITYSKQSSQLDDGIKLEGDKKPKARFGAAIGTPGDLNGDDYEDLLVGAPYEEPAGAVYVYNGGKNGIEANYSQKLLPQEMFPVGSFNGFGSSFSRPVDVTDNYYPDIAVGSFLANKAAILFSRPVITLKSHMSSSPEKLNSTDQTLTLEICSKYGGKNVPSATEILISVSVSGEGGVGIFEKGVSDQYEERKSLNKDMENCTIIPVTIINPNKLQGHIRFSMEHSIKEGSEGNPIINPKGAAVDPILVPFITGCERSSGCESHLILRAAIEGFSLSDRVDVGKIDELILDIYAVNVGEPAFRPYITIEVVEPLDFATSNRNCKKSTNQTKIILSCKLRNPILTKDTIDIELDLSALSDRSSDSNITIYLNIDSDHELNSENNFAILNLKLRKEVSLQVSGFVDAEQIEYERISENELNSTGTLQIDLISIISKTGATPVREIDIEMLLPAAVKDNNEAILPLIDISSAWIKFNGHSHICKSREATTHNNMTTTYEKYSRKLTAINCSSDLFLCKEVYCSIGPWEGRGGDGSLEVNLAVNLTTLSKLIVVSKGAVITTEIRAVVANVTEISEHITGIWDTRGIIEINLFPSQLGKSPLPWWALIVAIIGGILLIICLSYGLYKCGFFHRKKRDEMASHQSHLIKQAELPDRN